MEWSRSVQIFLICVLSAGILMGNAGCSVFLPDKSGQKFPYYDKTVPQKGTVIMNYTYTGKPHRLLFAAVPTRAVVFGQSAADTLIALGAEAFVSGVGLSDLSDPAQIDYYKKAFPGAVVTDTDWDRESVIHMRPDIIIGARRYFAQNALGNTEFWESRGAEVYIQENSGPIPSMEGFPPCTTENELNFIRHMGNIFNRSAQAEVLVEEIEGIVNGTLDKHLYEKGPRVLVIEFMKGKIELFGANVLSGDIIGRMGGRLIPAQGIYMDMETFLMQKPDVLFLVYHGGKKEKEAALQQISGTVFQNIKAVREGRVYPIEYGFIAAPAVHLKETAEILAGGLYPSDNKTQAQ